jgi:hypothetical protein
MDWKVGAGLLEVPRSFQEGGRLGASGHTDQPRVSANILVGIAVALVFAVLLAGLYTLWKGGDVAASWSNRLMRLRVLAQFIAIVIILVALYLSRR